MKIHSYFLSVGIVVFLASCAGEKPNEVASEDVRAAFVLEKQEIGNSLKLPGELVSFERAEITAKVEAYTKTILVDIGDKVKKGQILAVLEAPEVMAQYAEAQARFAEATSKLTASRDKYDRILKASSQSGAVSESDLVASKNQLLADSASWRAANLLAKNLGHLQEYLTLRAPFEGTVTQRNVDPGNLVSPSDTKPLLMVEKPTDLRLRVNVPESHIYSLPSDTGRFTVEALGGKEFSAKLSRKSGSVSADTRTELWEYIFENKESVLKPGMYVTVLLDIKRPDLSFAVPTSTVATTLEKKFVIRIKGGSTEWVDVRSGTQANSKLEIFGDLNVGDTLLVRASDELKSGKRVVAKIE
jgi:membrane fusion protein, multidrug efflux system